MAVLQQKGYIINHKTVNRLMRQLGLKVKVRRAKYKSYKGEVGKISPNILNRNFKATAPNQNGLQMLLSLPCVMTKFTYPQ